MTESLEDYLKAIAVLGEDRPHVRVTDVAALLDVSKPAVHNALHQLESRGLISHQQYGAVELTAEGTVEAWAIRKKHDVLKRFLEDLLGVEPDTAEREACAMEHDLSGETVGRLEGLFEGRMHGRGHRSGTAEGVLQDNSQNRR